MAQGCEIDRLRQEGVAPFCETPPARVLERAGRDFAVLRLRTERPEAVRLYESFGFVRTDAPGETHRLVL